jgi:hypothetical protein
MGAGALSSGVKRQASNYAEVKKIWTYTSTPQYAFMAIFLIS